MTEIVKVIREECALVRADIAAVHSLIEILARSLNAAFEEALSKEDIARREAEMPH